MGKYLKRKLNYKLKMKIQFIEEKKDEQLFIFHVENKYIFW